MKCKPYYRVIDFSTRIFKIRFKSNFTNDYDECFEVCYQYYNLNIKKTLTRRDQKYGNDCHNCLSIACISPLNAPSLAIASSQPRGF